MFILAHLDIIGIAVIMAIPFYFFNRYLLKKIKPADSTKNALRYFTAVLITALVYSGAGVFVMAWSGWLLK